MAAQQARADGEAALRALPGARRRLRHRASRARHELRPAHLRGARQGRAQGQRAVPGLPRSARAPRSTTTRSSPTRSAKWPVVLGVAMGGKEDIAGVLPPPVFDVKALGNVEYPYYTSTGYSGNVAVLQKRRRPRDTSTRPWTSTASRAACRCSCASRTASTRRCRSRSPAPTSATRRCKIVLDQPRKVGDRLEGWMRVDQDRRRAGTARPRDDRHGAVPRHGRLPLRVGDRRDPRHPAGRRAQGQDHHRGHLRPGPRRPARDLGARGPARASRCTQRSWRASSTAPSRTARPRCSASRSSVILCSGIPLAIFLPRLSATVVHRRGRGPLRARSSAPNLYLWQVAELGGAHRVAAADAGAALLPQHGLRLLRGGALAPAHHGTLRHLRAEGARRRRCRRTPASTR